MSRVLIVEDQDRVAKALSVLLDLDGIASVVARAPQAALACLEAGGFDLVLQDMNFTAGATSGDEGVALFREIRARHPGLPVLLLTAWAQLETAVELVRSGAANYLEKPWDDGKLLAAVREQLAAGGATGSGGRGGAASPAERRELAAGRDLCGLVYASAVMHDVVGLAVRVAGAEVPVLISGPSGTGKEKLAEIVHANSRRRQRPFLKVDAGALPETLLEAELFGAEAGAYTGSVRRRAGRFEAAHGGTLLLDEIGNLSLAGQAALLRVLQTGEFERLGSSETRRVDVRIIAATNIDLHRAIAAGTFREDLFYRLAVIEIELPPLAARRDDVLPLAERFLAGEDGEEPGTAAGGRRELSRAAREALTAHDWPGNVRELQNRIRRARLLARGPLIEVGDLGLATGDRESRAGDAPLAGGSEAAERAEIEGLLLEHGGIVSRAAESLGLSRQALYRRMERLGIVLERRPRS
ncbi:MAG: sigma-54-dependent transcriptional regulator [Thermoanaerobaculia bacterium]